MDTFIPSPDVIKKYGMDTTAFDNILKEIGEKYARVRAVEVENDLLKEQVRRLTQQNLMMKRVMEEKGFLDEI